jgi:hypothetical protein
MILLSACSENSDNKNFGSWLGNYEFNERPLKTFGGYSSFMQWELSVNKIGKIYKSILNVNGHLTSFSLLNNLEGNDKTLFIIYDSILSGVDPGFQKGDTLFSFSGAANSFRTRWASLRPMLRETTPDECRCFIFTGADKDNNTLKIPD